MNEPGCRTRRRISSRSSRAGPAARTKPVRRSIAIALSVTSRRWRSMSIGAGSTSGSAPGAAYRLGPRPCQVDRSPHRQSDRGGAEPLMHNEPRRRAPRPAEHVVLDDHVELARRGADQQVADGAAHEVRRGLAASTGGRAARTRPGRRRECVQEGRRIGRVELQRAKRHRTIFAASAADRSRAGPEAVPRPLP